MLELDEMLKVAISQFMIGNMAELNIDIDNAQQTVSVCIRRDPFVVPAKDGE